MPNLQDSFLYDTALHIEHRYTHDIIYYGVALMSACLKNGGFNVEIIDLQSKKVSFLEMKKELIKKNPKYIGITAIYGSMNEVYRIAKKCKEIFPNKKIIIGGLPATFAYERIFEECSHIDICVLGEGEDVIIDLMRGEKLDKIKGIAYRKRKNFFVNERREYKDMEKHPFPDYSLFSMDFYREKYLPYETSRGCPFACDFCCQTKKEGRKLREKSIKKVISDFHKISNLGFRRVMIVDNDFLTNIDRAKEMFKEIIKEKINKKLEFFIATRISNILRDKENIIKLMRDSNTRVVFVGIESLCEDSRKKLGKIKDIEDLKELFVEFERAGIKIIPSYIFGFPKESEEDMNKTYEGALYLDTEMFKFNIFTPYPGTNIYKEMSKSNLINKNVPLYKYDNLHNVYNNPLDIERIVYKFIEAYRWQKRRK